ncbi:MAG: dockerin type I repeat-containing protein, partial [Anaerolineales bacterium]
TFMGSILVRASALAAVLVVAGGLAAAQSTDPRPLYALENGDANGDWEVDLSDAVYLLSYLYAGGAEPVPIACGLAPAAIANGDSNGDRQVDLSDTVALLGHLFLGGSRPADCSGSGGLGAGGANPNPRVIPVNARPHGRSYGEWSGLWWAWAFSIHPSVNPLLDPTGANCHQGQSGPVWFLAGAFSSDTQKRTCTVPRDKAVFFPFINIECSTLEPPPFFGSNEAELTECAMGFFSDLDEATCNIDGQELSDLTSYRVQSPATPFTVGDENILGVPAGSGLLVSDGYWLMLPPLTPGEHTVHFTGLLGGGPFAGFSQDMTYHLTVD